MVKLASSQPWLGQGTPPAGAQLTGQVPGQFLEGRHLRHVEVLVRIRAVHVQLPGVHSVPNGIVGLVVVGHPFSVAVLERTHGITHGRGFHLGPRYEGVAWVLTEHGWLPRHDVE